MITLLQIFSKYHKVVIWFTVLMTLIAGAATFAFVDLVYKATVVILPSADSNGPNLSGISNIANLVGVNIGSASSTDVLLYPDIIKSRNLLEPLLLKKFKPEASTDSVQLISFLDIEIDTSTMMGYEKAMQRALKLMREGIIDVSNDKKTSLITIDVSMPNDRYIAADVANYLAEHLGIYNREDRRSKAQEQLDFIEKRIDEVTSELRRSEIELKAFQEKNRSIGNSPELQLQQSRLFRSVEINQAVYIELRKNWEVGKLEVIKATPVITILDPAVPPYKKAKPSRLLLIASATSISFFGSLLFFYFREKKKTNRELLYSWLTENKLEGIISLLRRIKVL